MKKLTILSCALFLVLPKISSQDTVKLTTGDKIIVNVVETGEKYVKYRKIDKHNGRIYKQDKEFVFVILYENGTVDSVFQKLNPNYGHIKTVVANNTQQEYTEIIQQLEKTSKNKIILTEKKGIDNSDDEETQAGQHTIYVEGFGNYINFYSIGYDYTLKLKEKHKLSFNFGVSYFLRHYVNAICSSITFAPEINYLYGKNHHFELGVGFLYDLELFHHPLESSYTNNEWFVPIRVGYRYQREKGGFFFKIAYIPSFTSYGAVTFTDNENAKFWFMPFGVGVAFGYTFKNRK
ncbi:MAG: hypothetical protein LBN95_10965 [Prevotellaceae bacterium]|jgi:hypothetical protein|nr:hypothetical protein [Prevotellaceae bacterium]